MKRLPIPKELIDEDFYLHEKILHARNCRRKFIKNLLQRKQVNQTTVI